MIFVPDSISAGVILAHHIYGQRRLPNEVRGIFCLSPSCYLNTFLLLTATITAPIVEAPFVAPIINQRIPIIPTMAPPAMINASFPVGVEPVLAPPIELIQPVLQQPISLYSLHPIQPLPPQLPHVHPPRVTSYNDRKGKLNKNGEPYKIYYCCTPERQLIPNAIMPLQIPTKHITETFRNNKTSYFTVRYNNHIIQYSYGAKSGYTRENAYNEAARCLRYIFFNEIAKLDNSSNMTNDILDTINVLLDENNDLLPQPLQLATSVTSSSSLSTSPLIIHDYEDNDLDFGAYDDHTNSSFDLDIAPLIVNFDDDMLPIEI